MSVVKRQMAQSLDTIIPYLSAVPCSTIQVQNWLLDTIGLHDQSWNLFSQASVWGSGRAGSCHCVQHREPGWVCEKWRNRTFLRLNRFQTDLASLCFSTVVYQCVENILFHSGIPLLCVIYRIPSNQPSCNDTQFPNPMTAKQLMAGVEILRQSSQSNADSLSYHNSHHSESESLSFLTKSNL